MIEVLVAILVLSVGVLGAAAMQNTALRTTQQSRFHTMALHLATDLADRIRSVAASAIGKSDYPYFEVEFDSENASNEPIPSCYGEDASCSEEEMIRFDIEVIHRRAIALLPEGRLKICRDQSPWDDTNQQFRWSCTSPDSSAAIVVKLGWREPRLHTEGTSTVDSEPGPQLLIVVGA